MSLSSTARRFAGCNLLLTGALAAVLGLSAGPAHANSYGSVTACTEDKGGSTQVTLPFKNAIRSLLATTQYGSQGYFQISAGSQLLAAGFVATVFRLWLIIPTLVRLLPLIRQSARQRFKCSNLARGA